jgi:LmbE family N-acetylglucosaminyl deacetylase
MIDVDLGGAGTPNCILLLGAHCDDIEIGCGGSLLRIAQKWPRARIVWVALSSDVVRAAETRTAARRFLSGESHIDVRVETFRASYFPYEGSAIKDFLESLKPLAPDLIFTHCRNDLHQDHRVVCELTWNTFRDHLILEYEIPKFDGDLGTPSAYVPLTRAQLQHKIDILLQCFPSQSSRPWFTADTFKAMARLRGIECNAPEGLAEAFYCRKLRLGI